MSTTNASTPDVTHFYKIVPSAPPTQLPDILPLSELDQNDGFIHLSTCTQVPATAARFFTDHRQLWLLKLKSNTFNLSDKYGRIVWEQAGNDGTFPHLYGGDLGNQVVDEVLFFERDANQTWIDVLGGLDI